MIDVHGWGIVSPAGWGLEAMRQTLARNEPVPSRDLPRPGSPSPLKIRPVPPPQPRPAFLAHPRLRRTSPISQFTVAAALEALGTDAGPAKNGELRLGIIVTVLTGSVNYSRRFYQETLDDPASASPLIFPETVFNAPASHLAALLETRSINYTLAGDPATFLLGLATAANWLLDSSVDGCIVAAAEEKDWLTAGAFRLFHRPAVLGEGAGAVYLKRTAPGSSIQLARITSPVTFLTQKERGRAAASIRDQLPPASPHHLLCDSRLGSPALDAAEEAVWKDWPGPRISPKQLLGEGLAAGSAWQCVAALDTLAANPQLTGATVSLVSPGQQALGAHFSRLVGGGNWERK